MSSVPITFTTLNVHTIASIGSTYVPPFATTTNGGAAGGAQQTATTTSTGSYANPNPTTPAFLDDWDWIHSYLTIHTMSEASYRYAYLWWLIIVFVILITAFLHLTGGRGGALGASWSKWALRRRTWRKKSTLAAIKKSNKSHRQPWTLPSNAQVLSLVFLFVIPAILCTIGSDYIAPGTKVWDLTHNLTKRALAEEDGYYRSLLPREGPQIASTATTRPPEFTIAKEWWTAGGRTGIIAASLLPLVVLFALKAPPFAILAIPFIIQIHFDKLARLHRWTGRVIWLITAVHVGTWGVQLYKDERHGHTGRAWNYVWIYSKFDYGFAAFGAMTLLTLLSLGPIRTRYYEFFYVTHVILVPATLVLTALHFPPLWWWAWAPLFLWILERVYRLVCFVYRNGMLGNLPKLSVYSGMGEDDGEGGYAYGRASTAGKRPYMQSTAAMTKTEAWEMDVRNPKSLDGHGSLRYNEQGEIGSSPVERVQSGDSFTSGGWEKVRNSAATGDTDETAAGEWSPGTGTHSGDFTKSFDLHQPNNNNNTQGASTYPPRGQSAYAPVSNSAAQTPTINRTAATSMIPSRSNLNLAGPAKGAPSTSLLHLTFPTMHPLPGILSASPCSARIPPPGYAKAILLPGRTIRMSVITARRFSWAAGQHILLTLPEISQFTSHPFTVASISDSAIAGPQGREIILVIRAKKGFTGALWDEIKRRRGGSESVVEEEAAEKGGLTQKQHGWEESYDSFVNANALSKGGRSSGVLFRAYVDGPFGSSVRAHWGSHSTVLIICGGSGVSFGTAILEYLCLCLSGRDGRSLGGKSGGVGKDSFVTRRVRFVWLIREYSHVQWCAPILRRCMDMIPNSSILQIDIFVTNFTDTRHKATSSGPESGTPYMLSSLGVDGSGALETGPDGSLVPPAPRFAREGKKLERRLSTSSLDSQDSNESRMSVADLHYSGGGHVGAPLGSNSGGDGVSEDGHHVLDLTNFDGDDDTRLPGEAHLSMKVKKEGKVRRAASRRQASAIQAKLALNNRVAPAPGGPSQDDFNPYNAAPQPIAPLYLPQPRVASPPASMYKTPARARNWDPDEVISPTPQRGVSLFDPPVSTPNAARTPQKWGERSSLGPPTLRAISPLQDELLPPNPFGGATTPTQQPRPNQQSLTRPPFGNDNRNSYAESLAPSSYFPAAQPFSDGGHGAFDTRTIEGSESTRNLMGLGGGPRPGTPNSAAWNYGKEEDVALLDYDDEEIDDLNVVSEMARPGKPRLDKIIPEEVERSRGAVVVACCGPASLNALTRKVVAAQIDPSRIKRGDLRGQITLISEDYEW